MSTTELKKELHTFIDQEDDKSVKLLYTIIQKHRIQKHKDQMIAEGEDDIKNGRLHTLADAKSIMDKW